MTASFGVATFPGDGKDATALLQAADKHLFQSKHLGNTVTG
jgi:GGDEF domain-containing protein